MGGAGRLLSRQASPCPPEARPGGAEEELLEEELVNEEEVDEDHRGDGGAEESKVEAEDGNAEREDPGMDVTEAFAGSLALRDRDGILMSHAQPRVTLQPTSR